MIGIGINIASGHPVVAPEAGGPSSAVVSGAGTAAANGTYQFTGTSNGKSYYNKAGSDPAISAIAWDGDSWEIISAAGVGYYSNEDDVALPWDTNPGNWALGTGIEPLPTITEG